MNELCQPCLRFKCFALFLSFLLSFMSLPSFAQSSQEDAAKRARLKLLKQLPIHKLSKVQFYNPNTRLAARKSRALIENPSAVFVLSGAEVRRAGITSLPEALRLVPGVQVARLYSNRWAISARGLNGYISSKLLVMIDGRTVYTPLRSEVQWGEHDMLIEDLDRIEVIRGPGASLWGANAVNGIINIVSKQAAKTQGGLVSMLLGRGEENAALAMRYGDRFGQHGAYRIYTKVADYDAFKTPQGDDAQDDWNTRLVGFRVDYSPSRNNSFTLQGDALHNKMYRVKRLLGTDTKFSLVREQIDKQSANILGRWQRQLTHGEWVLQSYYEWNHYRADVYQENRHTLDIDFQHRLIINPRQEYLWGVGVRHSHDDLEGHTRMLGYAPKQREDWLFSTFIQGEFVLQPKRWRLLIGSKFEHNNYTGFEHQPSVRVLWSPHEEHRLWAAISRAVRTPSRTDHNGFVETLLPIPQTPIPALFRINGNEDYESETLLAYELGYRYLPSRHFLLDSTLFVHDFKNLRSGEPVLIDQTQNPPFLLSLIDNQTYGEVLGIELSAQYQVTHDWRLSASYTYTDVQLHLQSGSNSVFGETEEGDSPQHQFNLFSQWNLSQSLQFDTAFYYVGKVENQQTPDYLRWDLHLGWQAHRRLKLDVGLRNALNQQHPEFGKVVNGNSEIPNEIPRSVYLQLRYSF